VGLLSSASGEDRLVDAIELGLALTREPTESVGGDEVGVGVVAGFDGDHLDHLDRGLVEVARSPGDLWQHLRCLR